MDFCHLLKKHLELLIQKNPDPRKSSPDTLIQRTTRPIYSTRYDDMDESIIMKASMLTKGGSTPSYLGADGWSGILTSRTFGTATVDFRKNLLS